MEKLSLLIFSLTSLISFAQDPQRCSGNLNADSKPHGAWTCTYPSGQVQFEIHYNAGQFNGLRKEYLENSQVRFEATYNSGMLNGVAKEYYENGQLKYMGTYNQGVPKGVHKEYNESGTLTVEHDFGS